MTDFIGSGAPLSDDGFIAAKALIGGDAAALWTVVSVETTGCGFLADRRPKILFERHIFSRLTNGRFDADDPDVSAPTSGGYGAGGAHQYLRLEAAMQLDASAALRSASWGLGQIMGGNFAQAGFADARAMVDAFVASENAQLLGMARFIANSTLAARLKQRDWPGFARLYNGPNYAANDYDGKLRDAYDRYSAGPEPDLMVRAAQLYLTYRGFAVNGIDGAKGPNTNRAVEAYQRSVGIPVTGVIDQTLIDLLAR